MLVAKFKAEFCGIGTVMTVVRLLLLVPSITYSSPAHAGFGEVIEIKGNSPFPQGWVVIGARGPTSWNLSNGPMGKNPAASLTFTIMDATGAEKGQELEVRGNSPIPAGWVIVKTVWPTILSAGKFTCPEWEAVHTIKCLVSK